MKEEAQKNSKTRWAGTLGMAIRIALGIWLLAGVVWAALGIGELFQVAEGSRPAVATDGRGNQVVVFQAPDGGIHGRLRDAGGRAVGIEFLISPDTEAARPDVAVLRSGGFIAAWQNGEESPAVVAHRFDRRGRAVGIEFLVDAEGQDPAIGIDDRGIMVAAWTAPAGSVGHKFRHVVGRFDARGRAVGIEFQLGRSGPATPPALAVQEAGRFLVVWEDDRGDVVAQAFDVDGTPLDHAIRVNQSRFGDQVSPDATAALDGDYTVVWERLLPGSLGRKVYGRRIAASGRAVGIEFLVSESTSERPTSPAIMADHRGNTVATWVSYQGHHRVLAREVSLDGRAVGIEFLVDAGTSATSVRTSRGGDTGDFVVIWDTEDGEIEPRILGRDLLLDESDDDDDHHDDDD